MKTKNFFKLFAMMILAFVCVGFASCGSDDDDNNGGGYPNELVGVWAQFHKKTASSVGYYYGIKLDANGEAAYTEWTDGKTPNWNYTGGGKWSASGGVLTLYAPNGSLVYRSAYSLSSDGKTITFVGDQTEGHFSTVQGEFVKQ